MGRLDRLLQPKSIAFFGGNWAAAAIRQTVKMGFEGQIWPVHPSKDVVEGHLAYRSVADLPEAPDAAFVGVNRGLTVDVVRDLASQGAGGAVCFASGFREAGAFDGDRLNDALLAAAGQMPILGPNCYGLINYCDGALLWPDQHGGVRCTGQGVALVTQSSNIAINMTMQARGLPLAYVVTAGNQAQTGVSDIALGLIEDPRVSALGLHIEGFDDIRAVERLAARAAALGKGIVALKVGRSEAAQVATISHTASLAGGAAAASAFLARVGIGEVATLEGFFAALQILHLGGPLGGVSVSSMSCSGGEASLVADAAERTGVRLPAMTADHVDRVAATLGPLVVVANPLDYHTFIWNDRAAMAATFQAMVAGGYDLNLLILDIPRGDRCEDQDWENTLLAFADALQCAGARGAVVASLAETMPEDWSARALALGIVPLHGVDATMAGIEAAHDAGCAPGAAIFGPVGAHDGQMLDEAAGKALLAKAGVPVPRGGPSAAGLTAPYAVKVLGLAHKTEAGAVRLGIGSDIEQVIAEMAALGPVYVEEMVPDCLAELMVGISRDPVLGPVLTIASGGVMVELLQDSVTLMLPASDAEIRAGLQKLRIFPLLMGFRGRPAAELDAVIAVIVQIAGVVVAQADAIIEMDINPLMITADGAVAADVLLVMAKD